MTSTLRKTLALLLCLTMVLTLVPAVFAEEEEELIDANEFVVEFEEENEEPVEPVEPEEPEEPEELEEPEEPEIVGIAIDEELFPDDAFRAYVAEVIDLDGDGFLTEEEISAVTAIACCGWGIASLDGLEIFTELTWLDCSDNEITALDVSAFSAIADLVACTEAGIDEGVIFWGDPEADYFLMIDEGVAVIGFAEEVLSANIVEFNAPVLVSAESVEGGIRFVWEADEGVAKFRVFRKVNGSNWKTLATLDGTEHEFLDKKVSDGMTYAYTVRCANEDGTKYTSAYDTVGLTVEDYVAAPKITTQPASQTVTAGNEVLFAVQAEGDSLSFAWQTRPDSESEWEYIQNETESMLVFVADKAQNGAQFRCAVSNDTFTVYSKEATLTVKDRTFSAPELKSVTILDKGIEFTWEAEEGVERFRVFRKVGTSNWKTLATVDGSVSSFVDKKVTVGTTYYYTVRCLSNDGKYTSPYNTGGLEVTFAAAPTITAQPVSQTVTVGEEASFTVVAEGEDLTFVWQTRPGSTGDWVDMEGECEDTLTFIATKEDNGTQYRCAVSNEAATAYSSVATLTVKDKTYDAPVPAGLEVTNDGLAFSWTADEDVEGFRVFRKVGDGSWKTVATLSGPVSSFVDTKAVYGNNYSYTVRCMNAEFTKYTSDYDTVGLSIDYLPVLVTEPDSVAVSSGENVVFAVETIGPKVKPQWQVRYSEDEEWTNLNGETGAELSLNAALYDNGMQLRCVLNGGLVASGAATLSVTTVVDDVVYEGITGTMTCRVIGYNGEDSSLVIPDMIEDLPVTEIGPAAFLGNEVLTAIALPDGITLIDTQAFMNCINLSSMTSSSQLS